MNADAESSYIQDGPSPDRESGQPLEGDGFCFRTIVNDMLEPFSLMSAMRDADGKIFNFRVDFVNQAVCDSVNLPVEELVGKTLHELFPGRLESALVDEYVRVVETGEPVNREAVTYIDVFGESMLTRAFDLRVFKNGDGVAASWRDITDRVRADKARAWLAAIAECAADAIVGVNPECVIESWSAGAENLYGYGADEIVGRPLRDLVAPESLDAGRAMFTRVLAGERLGPEESIDLHRDGRRMIVSVTAAPVLGEHGEVMGAARIARPVERSAPMPDRIAGPAS